MLLLPPICLFPSAKGGHCECSRKYGIDLDKPRERRRIAMTLCIADFAIEWLRSLPPNFKVGPVLPEPASPLPAHLEVCCFPPSLLTFDYVIQVMAQGFKLRNFGACIFYEDTV